MKQNELKDKASELIKLKDSYSEDLSKIRKIHELTAELTSLEEDEASIIDASVKSFSKIYVRLYNKYSEVDKKLIDIQKSCNHTNDNGKSAYVYEGHNSHKEFYECSICGNWISI